MKRLFKWLLGALAALLVLMLLVAVLVPLLFDVEDLKRTIEARVSQATGRELRIGGDLELKVFPWLAVATTDISLGNAPGFGEQPFARIAEARIGVALMPLLRKELVVDEVMLDGLQLDLQLDAQGNSNWSGLLPSDDADTAAQGPAFAQPRMARLDLQLDAQGNSKWSGQYVANDGDSATQAPAFTHLEVAGLDLRNAQLSYRDASEGSHWVFSELALKTGALRALAPVDFKLQTLVEDRLTQLSMQLEAEAELTMDLAAQQYGFRGLDLQASSAQDGIDLDLQAPAAGVDLATMKAMLEEVKLTAKLEGGNTQAEIQGARLEANLETLLLTLTPVQITAQLDGGKTRARIDSARLEADLAQQRFGFSQAKAELNLEGQAEALPLEAVRADLDLGASTLALEQFTTRLGGVDIGGSLTASDLFGDPTARGHLSIPAFEPRKLFAALGIEAPVTTDPKALGRGSLETDFDGSAKHLELSNMELGLDDSRISGAFSMPVAAAGAMLFDLDIDRIDLDRYLPPESEGAAVGGALAALPRDALRGLDLEGSLRVGKLRLLGMDLDQFETVVTAQDNQLRLSPFNAGLFGGRYQGDITLDASGEGLAVKAEHHLESLGLQHLGSAFAGLDDLSGTLIGDLVTEGRGVDAQQLLSSLSGSLDLQVLDGALEGVNLWQEVRKAYATYKGRPAPPAAPERTEFSRLSLKGPIRNGVIETQELAGEVQVLSLTGKGGINLARGQLDLGVSARVRDAPEVLEDPLVANLVGKRLPLRISGPVASPSVGVDFAELLKGEAADALLKKLGGDEPRDPDAPVSEKDQAKDAATSLLRDLLNKDKNKQPPVEDEGGG